MTAREWALWVLTGNPCDEVGKPLRNLRDRIQGALEQYAKQKTEELCQKQEEKVKRGIY